MSLLNENNGLVERRVLICSRLPRDALLLEEVLANAGMPCHICETPRSLQSELLRGVGTLLVVEEVLATPMAAAVNDFVHGQPVWSDLPILVLTRAGRNSFWVDTAFSQLGNPTFLDRPVRSSTIVSAARSALRARERQYQLRAADHRKDEFLAMLGHELRNPLAPIGAAAQLLEIASTDSEKVKHSSKVIGRQVKHMTALIDDLLDVARVTRGLVVLDRKPINMTNVLTQAVEQATPIISGRNHQLALLITPAPAWVLGDEKRLVQVLANLLTNAAKYTNEFGRIDVRLNVTDVSIRIEVIDNGIGMTSSMISRVFELFAQAERTSARTQGGLGLGLALVKSLVSLHGGRIVAESPGLDMGSTFTLELPRLLNDKLTESLNLEQVAEQIRRDTRPLRVLVVDDNADATTMLELLLTAMGHEVTVANLAVEAIVAAEGAIPDVCLIDIGLPDMDGNALVAHLRELPSLSASLFVAVTGYGQDQDIQKSRQAGFDHHLVKPVDSAVLQRILMRAADFLESAGHSSS